MESHKSEWIRVFVERKTSSYKTFSIIEGLINMSNIYERKRFFHHYFLLHGENISPGENQSSIQVFIFFIFLKYSMQAG